MRQVVKEEHTQDVDGTPTGGSAEGVGFAIRWQHGPLSHDGEANGAFVEGIIQAAIGRLRFFNGSKFSCPENSRAIAHLEEALHQLDERTENRKRRGVEGTTLI